MNIKKEPIKHKKIYFASDTHFGARTLNDPIGNERRFVCWLDRIKPTTEALYLLGDMIDFWFEYRTVVPRGFTRFFGKLGEFTDAGIEVHWFTGNHDLWMGNYLTEELGIIVHRKAMVCQLKGKEFLLAHGDEFSARNDYRFRFIRRLFHSTLCQRLLAAVHPRWTVAVAHGWSKESREKGDKEYTYRGEENEPLVRFAKEYLQTHKVDFLVFGHRHIPLDLLLQGGSRLIILGDWIEHFTYGAFDGENFELLFEEDWIENTLSCQEENRHKEL